MNSKEFCAEMAVKLKQLDRFFQLQMNVASATAETDAQQRQRRPRRDEARTRVEALRKRLDTVCADTALLTDAVRTEIEQQLATVMELLK